MIKKIVAAVLVSAFGAVPLAHAGSVTAFSDLSTFQTALGSTPVTLETFTDAYRFPISTGILNSATNLVTETGPAITPGTIQPGVTYTTPIGTGNFFNIDCCNGTSGPFLDTVTSNGPLTATFDKNTWAFGFNTAGRFIDGLSVTINFAVGPSYSQNFLTNGNDGFYGFMSSGTDIQSVVIGGSRTAMTFAVDNFRFTTAPVPEPETYAMLLAGLSLMGAVSRRRKKHCVE